MENRLLNNLVDNMVLNELRGHDYLYVKDDIVEIFERFCDNSEDLSEILNIIANSKRYNYITLQNGISCVFGARKEDVEDFIYNIKFIGDIQISAFDPVWNDWIYYGEESCKLKDLL